MRHKQPTNPHRRLSACAATDRRRPQAQARKATAEVFIGTPGALRRLLNGASVNLTDADTPERLKALRAAEQRRAGPLTELFLDDLDGALVAARWARRFRRAA